LKRGLVPLIEIFLGLWVLAAGGFSGNIRI
jgi:hypothetical protein